MMYFGFLYNQLTHKRLWNLKTTALHTILPIYAVCTTFYIAYIFVSLYIVVRPATTNEYVIVKIHNPDPVSPSISAHSTFYILQRSLSLSLSSVFPILLGIRRSFTSYCNSRLRWNTRIRLFRIFRITVPSGLSFSLYFHLNYRSNVRSCPLISAQILDLASDWLCRPMAYFSIAFYVTVFLWHLLYNVYQTLIWL